MAKKLQMVTFCRDATRASSVTAENAYRYGDNYAVAEAVGGGDVVGSVYGCEHNREEAEAVARWLAGEKGRAFVVVANGRATVEAAKKFRPEPLRVRFREEALRAMGVWPK